MATLIYSRRGLRDLERLAGFIEGPKVIDIIAEAIEILAHHPYVGRKAEHGLRELVISRGKTGYIALSDYAAEEDVIAILAVRHQHEAGYEP